jgi:ribosomal protein S19
VLTIVVSDIVDHCGWYHQPQWSTISPTTMVNNITNHNGQQYHQPQWLTISPTTMVNNITNHNGQQYHQQQCLTVNHCCW